MSDWILGLKKAATAWMPGISAEELHRAEAQAGESLPDELRALYRKLDGALFEDGVALFPVRPRDRGGLLEPGEPVPGLPTRGIWRFGVRGEGEPLFAARKAPLAEAASGASVPEWFDALPDDAWVYGFRGNHGELYLHPSLRQLMSELIPPAETEDFGESTFLHALQAVGSVLEEALRQVAEAEGGEQPAPEIEGGEQAASEVSPAPRRPARRAAKVGAKRSVGKGARSAAPARKAAPKAGKPAKKSGGAARKGPRSAKAKSAAGKATARERKPAGRAPARKAPPKRPAKRPSRRR